MADWTVMEREWTSDRLYEPFGYPYYQEKPALSQSYGPQAQQYLSSPSPTLTLLLSPTQKCSNTPRAQTDDCPVVPRGENPRELRNKTEKQRRDRLNQSIAELAAVVPPVAAATRKVDKTSVLRLAAHYLRSHQHVFGDAVEHSTENFTPTSSQALLGLLKGFLLTTTYKGIVVVVSQNVQQYLGYSEVDLLGQNILNIVHPSDFHILRQHLMPRSELLGPNGELLVPAESEEQQKLVDELANDKRCFIVRFRKLKQRTEPCQYVMCTVEGSFRKSDKACYRHGRGCQIIRRARARGENSCSSGNDIVFIGVVRPTTETFMTESSIETYKMEYRTRHSVDGEIIQCDQRIAMVTGYMTHEVNGINAMNFMHRDDVRWVIIALREMYDENRVFGESCYRLMTKSGDFIYMRTRGQLDVDGDSRAVRSFVCTNTLVDEREGKHLIKIMKKKFMLMVNDQDKYVPEESVQTVNGIEQVPIEDPRQLEKVILHLVTNLPSPQPEPNHGLSSHSRDLQSLPLSIIPHRKERIVSAIEKIYTVVRLSKEASSNMEHSDRDFNERDQIPRTNPAVTHTATTDTVSDVYPPPTYTEATSSSYISPYSPILSFNTPGYAILRTSPLTRPADHHVPYYMQSPLFTSVSGPEISSRMTDYSDNNNFFVSNRNALETPVPRYIQPVPRFMQNRPPPIHIHEQEQLPGPSQEQQQVEPQPGPSGSCIKRSSCRHENEPDAKKKIVTTEPPRPKSGHLSAQLLDFFEDDDVNKQIANVNNEAYDSRFPGYLTSKDGQEYIDRDEAEETQEQTDTSTDDDEDD